MSGPSGASGLIRGAASRSRVSTATTAITAAPSSTYWAAMSNTAEVVSITVGDVSVTTALIRSSCEPGTGTESGTAMNPACMAPRKATM